MRKVIIGVASVALIALMFSCKPHGQELNITSNTISCRGTCSNTNNTTYCALTFTNGKASCGCSGGGSGCTIMVLDKVNNVQLEGDALNSFVEYFSKKEHFENQLLTFGKSIYDTTLYKIDSITTSSRDERYFVQYYLSGGKGETSVIYTYDGTTKIAWECTGTCSEGKCMPVCEIEDKDFKVVCSCSDSCKLVKKVIK